MFVEKQQLRLAETNKRVDLWGLKHLYDPNISFKPIFHREVFKKEELEKFFIFISYGNTSPSSLSEILFRDVKESPFEYWINLEKVRSNPLSLKFERFHHRMNTLEHKIEKLIHKFDSFDKKLSGIINLKPIPDEFRENKLFLNEQSWILEIKSKFPEEILIYIKHNGNFKLLAHSENLEYAKKKIDQLIDKKIISENDTLFFA